MVYFFQGTETGNIKIGYTADNVARRLQEIISSDLLICLAVIKEAYTDTHYHLRFRHLWLHGEWFRAGDDLMAFINGLPKNEYSDMMQNGVRLGIQTGYRTSKPACYDLSDGVLRCQSCKTSLPDQQKRIREVWSPKNDPEARRILHAERVDECPRCGKRLPWRAYFHAHLWKTAKIPAEIPAKTRKTKSRKQAKPRRNPGRTRRHGY